MLDEVSENRPLAAVAGASGFVGTHIRDSLAKDFKFRALTRSPNIANQDTPAAHTEWRHCDLYSLPKVTEALEGCKVGIYLVHSMSPSSRLVQADFADTDVLLADNFVRASEAVGIEHIVYLSGLMPEDEEAASPHLRSRREVEFVLRSRGIPVTVLRAGLIFGPGGSSFSMLINLVRRLPVMLMPQWTQSLTQSIDIKDVCRCFEAVLEEPNLHGETYDIAGHEAMTYRDLILKTGENLGYKTKALNFPLNCFTLSRRWVSLFGQVPCELVGPLLESLKHNLKARSNPLLDRILPDATPFEESLARSVKTNGVPKPNPRSATRKVDAAF